MEGQWNRGRNTRDIERVRETDVTYITVPQMYVYENSCFPTVEFQSHLQSMK